MFSNRHDEPSEIKHVALVFENELGVYKISKVSFIGNEDLKFIYERYARFLYEQLKILFMM